MKIKDFLILTFILILICLLILSIYMYFYRRQSAVLCIEYSNIINNVEKLDFEEILVLTLIFYDEKSKCFIKKGQFNNIGVEEVNKKIKHSFQQIVINLQNKNILKYSNVSRGCECLLDQTAIDVLNEKIYKKNITIDFKEKCIVIKKGFLLLQKKSFYLI